MIERFAPDVCLHAAWITTPGVYLESAENESYLKQSLHFLKRLAALGTGGIAALGTCIEYQPGPGLLSEDRTLLLPTTAYAQAKHALHTELSEALAGSGTVLCWARLFYPYGVGEHPDRLCSSIIRKLGRKETVTLQTPDSTKDYIHVEDVARALLLVTEARFNGAINIGTGRGITVGDLARAIARLMQREELVKHANPPRPDSYECVVADAARLYSLGWKPEVPIVEGLQRLIRHLSLN
jgi:dTDP-6-deoxy-L-talose 4-dehydrogenase (NAD+)